MYFQVVHVSPVGVHVAANGMAGAMNKVLLKTGALDVISHRPVDFPARNRISGVHSVLYCLYSDVARLADDFEDFAHAIGGSLSHKAGPGNVVIHGSRR